MKNILPKLINEDQTGYIKNRFIGFNLRQIQDIIDYSNIYKIEWAIIFLDFSKAFDSLEWDFNTKTLWVQLFFCNLGGNIVYIDYPSVARGLRYFSTQES